MGNIMEQAYEADRYIAGECMAEMLMDDKVSTYKMYEDLYQMYRYSSPSEKSIIDRTLSILVNHNLEAIASEIMARVAEEKNNEE